MEEYREISYYHGTVNPRKGKTNNGSNEKDREKLSLVMIYNIQVVPLIRQR